MSETDAEVSGHGTRIIWKPGASDAASSRMRPVMDCVEATRGVRLETYRDSLEWSIADLSGFWETLREFFDVLGDGFDGPALAGERMPGAVWYPNARLTYAEKHPAPRT